MRILIALLSGLLFGIGLILSGMTNPSKVQNFLDVFGSWDPSLAFVMGGAILVTAPGYFFARKLGKPLFAVDFALPTKNDLDSKLLTGASLFGIGWGLGGFCPGPAITAFSGGATQTFVFLALMFVGIGGTKIVLAR